MKKDYRVYLDDIIESSSLIAKYISGKNKEQFDNDSEMQDAVIRRLEVIGEAIKRLPMEFREQYSEIEWKSATGMRDILIHHYDEVETKQIWLTVTEILPSFKIQIEKLLQQLS
jgi:uncharacterized protein with HEPN domain